MVAIFMADIDDSSQHNRSSMVTKSHLNLNWNFEFFNVKFNLTLCNFNFPGKEWEAGTSN